MVPHTPPNANITVNDIELSGSADVSFLCKRVDHNNYDVATTITFDNLARGGIEISNTLTIKGHMTDIQL